MYTHFDLTKTMVLCNTSAQHELVVIWNVYACIGFQNKYLQVYTYTSLLLNQILELQDISDNEFLSDANFSIIEWVARLYIFCHVMFSSVVLLLEQNT